MNALWLCIAFVALLALDWLRTRYERRMPPRQVLSFDEIYAQFYADSSIPRGCVRELWYEVAETLHVEPGKLRPSDVLGKDVGRALLTSDDLDSLTECALARMPDKHAVDLSKVMTVDDYVRAMSRFC